MQTMKIRFAVLILSLMMCALVGKLGASEPEDSDIKPLVDCGVDKAVIFEKSKDGQYATGWTIRPKDKQAEPVDWTLWGKEDPSTFMNRYDWNNMDKDDAPYELLDCVIDLKRKNMLLLPSNRGYYSHKDRAGFTVLWSPQADSRRFALIVSDARFCTRNLWLVEINGPKMRQLDLVPRLDKAIQRILQDKRPLDHDSYEATFAVGSGNSSDIGSTSFSKSGAQIPFIAEIPKADAGTVEGVITLRLPEGVIEKIESNTPRDNPFQTDAELAKADRELNQTYAALQKQLTPQARAALKQEQRWWIARRDSDAAETGKYLRSNERRSVQLEALREATRTRNAELKKRLGTP
jgi:uncharacterized protein YecT (DUF1311 family)